MAFMSNLWFLKFHVFPAIEHFITLLRLSRQIQIIAVLASVIIFSSSISQIPMSSTDLNTYFCPTLPPVCTLTFVFLSEKVDPVKRQGGA